MSNTKDEQWLKIYNLAKEYYDLNNNLFVPKRYITKNNVRLGAWIQNQRTNFKKDLLSQERINLLESIGMIWEVDKEDPIMKERYNNSYKRDKEWFFYYALAKEYFKEKRHLAIAYNYETKDGIKLGAWISEQRKKYKKNILSKERIELLESIHMIWDINEYTWFEKYELLKEYYEKYGEICSESYIVDNIKLGTWVQTQRKRYKNNIISKEQIDLLEEINFIWDASIDYINIWNSRFNLCKQYYYENGHLLIPDDYIIDNFSLGKWIKNQRTKFKNDKLTKKQIELLNSIGMIWDASNRMGTSFPEYLVYYYFKIVYGEDKVLYRDKSLGEELDVYIPSLKIAIEYDGQWHKNKKKQDERKNILCQKNLILLYRIREDDLPILKENEYVKIFSIKKGPSNEEICNKIIKIFKNEINFNIKDIYNEYALIKLDWLANKWQEKYLLAKEYYKENNNLLININYETKDGTKLGQWISKQRQDFRNNILSNEKINLLDSIGMSWFPLDESWQIKYNIAKKYFEENNNLNVLQNYETKNGIKLGIWISDQRKYYKNNKLSQEQINLLEEIGMIWDVLEYQWQENFKLAKQYYYENGHLLIPQSYEINGLKLGNWISHQRQSYKNILLPKEKINLLDSIEMVWDVSIDTEQIWMDYYNLSKEYYQENGNLLIKGNYTINNINLGQWISNQRDNYKNNKLSEEQIKLLNAINMVWNTFDFLWQEKYELAKKYYEENGHLLIPNKYETKEGIKLGAWISKQRIDYKNTLLPKEKRNKKRGILTQEQIKFLESIGMVWSIK